jgi:cation transporter-like permease
MQTPKILEGLSRGSMLLLAVLLALLIAAIAFAVSVWTSEQAALPPFIWAALAGGVFFSLVVGVGLMALIFYSSRAGYDDAPQIKENEEPPKAAGLSRDTKQGLSG